MPRERADLIETHAGTLPVLDGRGDGRMVQRVSPDVQTAALAEFAHDGSLNASLAEDRAACHDCHVTERAGRRRATMAQIEGSRFLSSFRQ
jgi:hypothetical protein